MTLITTSEDDITFEYRKNQQIKSTLQLKNVSNNMIAFKVKATNPKQFQVIPNKGEIEANQSITLEFIIESAEINEIQKLVNGKFQIRAFQLNGKENEQEIENLWKTLDQQTNTPQQSLKLSIEIYQYVNGRKQFFAHEIIDSKMLSQRFETVCQQHNQLKQERNQLYLKQYKQEIKGTTNYMKQNVLLVFLGYIIGWLFYRKFLV
ncbi:PapD-like protein [Pseudocohnilembus persalinus]|uniref:PapD-like protein n=1 Tax=Pseudocohnilembus persalinus TaxID=266149 RepID=A0A0V0Q9S1_PSEPJ|nr:PapD-like protein [Pseudocohnilembus persalinus]|eukprot:KRW98989.1 PapD-like protein [Pseudocohnilembus persalinus]